MIDATGVCLRHNNRLGDREMAVPLNQHQLRQPMAMPRPHAVLYVVFNKPELLRGNPFCNQLQPGSSALLGRLGDLYMSCPDISSSHLLLGTKQ